MGVPINTIEGVQKRISALTKIYDESGVETMLCKVAIEKITFWSEELRKLERKQANDYIEDILRELE